MPRLTPKQYLDAHAELRQYWFRDDPTFAGLSPAEQRQLHDFFQPSRDFTDADLLAYRKAVSATRQSLPQQAGRALAKFRRHATPSIHQKAATTDALTLISTPGRASASWSVVVKDAARPVPDIDLLVEAIMALGKQLQHEQETHQDQDKP